MLIATMAGFTAAVTVAAMWRMRGAGTDAEVQLTATPTVRAAGILRRPQTPHASADASSASASASVPGAAPAPAPAPAPWGASPRVSVVVPALNEEESIDWVVENIPDWVSEVVLVDGLSVDGTELVVTDRRADVVIVHQRSKGKGAALRAGFAAATGDIIVMIDADGSIDPREMGRYVDALIEGAEFVKGSRNLPGGGSVDFTLLRHLGNLGFVYGANLLFGVRFTDLCYGYCAFWRRDLDRLALTADGFEIEMELVLSAVKAGLKISEVPSMELERRAGNSNLNAWKDGKRVLKTLIRQRLKRLDPGRARRVRIRLAPVLRAAHSTRQWVPAGVERRRPLAADRRRAAMEKCAARRVSAGSERRFGQRRTVPAEVSEVLIAQAGSAEDSADPSAVPSTLGLAGRSA